MLFDNYIADFTKRFILSKKKKQDIYVDSLTDSAEASLTNWRYDLVEALSDPLSPTKQHRLRYPRNRLFPYMNSGELSSSVFFDVDKHTTQKSAVVVIKVNDLSSDDNKRAPSNSGEKHAWATNNGIRAPKRARQGAWVGWADDVFGGHGRGDVQSLKDIFNELHKMRIKL